MKSSINIKSSFMGKVRTVASPHFYHERSATLQLVQNLMQVVSFVRTPAPARDCMKSMKRMQGSKSTKTALVLGAGPSADLLITSRVPEFIDDIFVINGFNNLTIAGEITPSYYGLSDPAHFGPLEGKQLDERNEILNYVKNCSATLILPHTAFGSKVFDNHDKLFFDDRELTFFNNSISPIRPRGYGSTTIYKMLAAACHFGYQRIYLLGVDNTNFLNYVGRVDNKLTDLGQNTANRKIHFKSSLIREYEQEFTSGIAGRMQSYAHLFGDLMKFPSSQIINLHKKSLVDAFPKLDSHPLIRDC
jgi:hypothetical protein